MKPLSRVALLALSLMGSSAVSAQMPPGQEWATHLKLSVSNLIVNESAVVTATYSYAIPPPHSTRPPIPSGTATSIFEAPYTSPQFVYMVSPQPSGPYIEYTLYRPEDLKIAWRGSNCVFPQPIYMTESVCMFQPLLFDAQYHYYGALLMNASNGDYYAVIRIIP